MPVGAVGGTVNTALQFGEPERLLTWPTTPSGPTRRTSIRRSHPVLPAPLVTSIRVPGGPDWGFIKIGGPSGGPGSTKIGGTPACAPAGEGAARRGARNRTRAASPMARRRRKWPSFGSSGGHCPEVLGCQSPGFSLGPLDGAEVQLLGQVEGGLLREVTQDVAADNDGKGIAGAPDVENMPEVTGATGDDGSQARERFLS